jgi:hypothetical protein
MYTYVRIHIHTYIHTESRGDKVGSALCKWRRKSFAASLSLLARAAPRSSSTTSSPGVSSNVTPQGSVGPGVGVGEGGGGGGREAAMMRAGDLLELAALVVKLAGDPAVVRAMRVETEVVVRVAGGVGFGVGLAEGLEGTVEVEEEEEEEEEGEEEEEEGGARGGEEGGAALLKLEGVDIRQQILKKYKSPLYSDLI